MLAVHPDDLQRAFAVWCEPEYRDLVLDRYLANTLPVWRLLGAPARASIVDEEHTPYLSESSEPTLARVLAEEWAREELLAALPT